MQRRQDIFIAGTNEISGEEWVMSMGHLMGLFDQDFLGICHTRKMASLRYAEFSCVENGKICKSGSVRGFNRTHDPGRRKSTSAFHWKLFYLPRPQVS